MNNIEKQKTEASFSSSGAALFMVVTAPSGTGKTSVCREFLKMCPNIRFSVSSTTRPPRPGEKNGLDYFFLSEAAFREQIEKEAFAEWTQNFGHYYGTPKEVMQNLPDAGCDLLLDVESRGAKVLKRNYPDGVFVFILPPTLQTLQIRLNTRGELPEIMQERLNKTMDEIREIVWYDYVIINENIQCAADDLRSIYIAEKSRRERMIGTINAFLDKTIDA